MDKQIMLKDLATRYHAKAFTKNYIMVYNVKGVVYFTVCTSDLVDDVVCLDKASRGKGYSLRFKPNNKIREMLLAKGAQLICSTEYFKKLTSESKYNKGEIFEKLVTEWYGQTWEKDSIPFTEDGDLTVDGIAYQIKFEQATFLTEAQMLRLRG